MIKAGSHSQRVVDNVNPDDDGAGWMNRAHKTRNRWKNNGQMEREDRTSGKDFAECAGGDKEDCGNGVEHRAITDKHSLLKHRLSTDCCECAVFSRT